MTVRWKPLIVLSGLFLTIGVMGLLAITFALAPGKAEDVLPKAREDAKAGRFEEAEIRYKIALKRDPKKAEIHEEFAEMLARWMQASPAKRNELRVKRIHELVDAKKYGPSRPGPRKSLLVDALAQDDLADAAIRADELLNLDPKDADAHYAKALDALQKQPADTAAAKQHLAILMEQEPTKVRTLWIQARTARETGDETTAAETIAKGRALDPKTLSDTSERLARLRIMLIAISRGDDPKAMAGLVGEFSAEAQQLASEADLAPARVRILTAMLEQVQKQLKSLASRNPEAKKDAMALSDSLEPVADTIYARALAAFGSTDLRAHWDYAEHLAFRDEFEKAYDVADKALKTPMGKAPTWDSVANGLRYVAIRSALTKTDNPARFEAVAPHIKSLLESSNAQASGLGHLYQGLIALDRSGLAFGTVGEPTAKPLDKKLRDEAVKELKLAAEKMPDAATPRALYGVVLILSGETEIGRQNLQAAQRLGGDRLEPRYQVFAAWSILRAGYPEDAAPIVARLLELAEKSEIPRDVAPTLHMLMGQIHQARQAFPQARVEYQKAIDSGQALTPALQIRMAQIELILGETKSATERLAKLKGVEGAGASAERLMIQSLIEMKKPVEARKALEIARTHYPEADELVELDATMWLAAAKPEKAEKAVADYLEKRPGHDELALFRARILAGPLKKPDDARKLLVELVQKAENSAPLVQLALLDLFKPDLEAAKKTIGQLRARWPDAATADLLDAQLAINTQQPQAAMAALDVALKKDPGNKVALLWKAMLDDRAGAQAKAAPIFESIVKDDSMKDLGAGQTLSSVARWALADMALQNQDLDGAISRFEGLLKTGAAGDLDRPARWKLVAAHTAKGQVALARAEVIKLVAAADTSPEERVQAADFYRRLNDDAACLAQLDRALKDHPENGDAATYRALVLASQKKIDEAAATVRRSIAAAKQPAKVYLMLAAVEKLAAKDGTDRSLKALEQGLAVHPNAIELIQVRYQLMASKKDPKAVALVEEKAKADSSPEMKRLLAEVYRIERRFDESEAILRELLKQNPQDNRLAAGLVAMTASRAVQASEAGNRTAEREANIKTGDLVRQFRASFPTDATFLQADCELAARMGDLAKAKRLCAELSELDQNSPIGPILRARIYATENNPEEVAKAYEEALLRAPRRIDIRPPLAQTYLTMGKTDEALKQTKYVLDIEHNDPTATLLNAQALAMASGTPDEVAKRRVEAAKSLQAAIKNRPTFTDAYHQLAQIRAMQGDRTGAITTLKEGLKAVPNDDTGLSSLVQILCQATPTGPASIKDIQEAKALAEVYGARDERGVFALALAVGFHAARQIDLAVPWAEKAAEKIDQPVVHLTYGDILMAKGAATTVEGDARKTFMDAVAQYDIALKTQANQVGAINNKAWILHHYLGKHAEALDVAEGLVRRSDPATLPSEFYDTLGSIYEAMNRQAQAEEAYQKGLRKSPEGAMLNLHMGKLLAPNPSRAGIALRYLEKAQAGKNKLSPDAVAELDRVMKTVAK